MGGKTNEWDYNCARLTDNKTLKIIFFGTPAFAEASLRAIHQNGYEIAAVVTAPDRPAGRGHKLQASAVKTCALELGLPVLQPEKLRDTAFIHTIRALQADLQVVIAFRMLPELVWNMPPLGTMNLHASYLPWYRGAAPINRVIMNGEKETGLTTFFLRHEIDTGNILMREKVRIGDDENAGELHDRLMVLGADLVIRSLSKIDSGSYDLTPQESGNYPHAPKIFSEDCVIDWTRNAEEIRNQIRGLSPSPCAFTAFQDKKLKIFSARLTGLPSSADPGTFEITENAELLVHCPDFVLQLEEVQWEGKKRMPAKDFLNGLK